MLFEKKKCKARFGHCDRFRFLILKNDMRKWLVHVFDLSCQLITIFMTSHDPTTPDRQGADRGTQYRSIILYHDAKQKQTVDMVLKSLKSSFPNSIVTEVAPLEAFYNAEIYHQNYFNSNSTAGYCRVVIDPKIKKIREKYADKLKKEMMD